MIVNFYVVLKISKERKEGGREEIRREKKETRGTREKVFSFSQIIREW